MSREDLTKSNARQIRAWLALHGLNVTHLAQALGVSAPTAYNYLSGRQAWPARAARIVSLATGVPLRALLDPRGEAAADAAAWLRSLEPVTPVSHLDDTTDNSGAAA